MHKIPIGLLTSVLTFTTVISAEAITHSHTDARIEYHGAQFPKHTADYVQLNRFSDEVLANPVGFNVDRALVPSCVVIRFTTSSPTIEAHFGKLATEKDLKMPQYAVYRNDTDDITDYEEFKYSGDVTDPVLNIVSDDPGNSVTYEILLPSMHASCFKGLILETGYDLEVNPVKERPTFVAIGDSITMSAGHQSKSYETYTWKFGRSRGMDIYNIAVSGAVTAPDWGSMFPDLEPEFITVLFGINDWNTANDLTIYRDKYMRLLDNVRADHPDTPLFCITLVAVGVNVDPIGSNGVTVDEYRNEIISMVNERRTAGDPNIYCIPGHAMTEATDLADDFHFDMDGTSKFATNLDAAIDEILVNGNYTEVPLIPIDDEADPYADWATLYGIDTGSASYSEDADNDGLNNFGEFATGDNPISAMRTEASPVVRSGSSENVLEFVYRRRRDAATLGISYTVEQCADINAGSWNTTGVTETATTVIDADFESVTNEVVFDSCGFVRLKIEMAE